MPSSLRAAAVAALIWVAGCAGGADVYGDPETGYLADIEARLAGIDWSRAEDVAVELTEYAFEPSSLAFRVGMPYRLRLENRGGITHYFASGGFFRAIAAGRLSGRAGDVAHPRLEAIAVPARAARTLTFVPVRAGVYELRCTAPFHAAFGMTGEIRIE